MTERVSAGGKSVNSEQDEKTGTQNVLRLHAEELQVERRNRVTGEVRVSVQTRMEEHVVDEVLRNVHVETRVVPVGRFVEEAPDVRVEGDTTIIPIIEEVVVRRLLLREEVHVVRTPTRQRHQETVSLRREQAVISRTTPKGSVAAAEDATAEPDPAQHPPTQSSSE